MTAPLKHSDATEARLSVKRNADGINVVIRDNGKGFDTSAKEKMNGIGLKNIQTRVEYLKGTVEFDSAAGKGTAISLHVPLVALDK